MVRASLRKCPTVKILSKKHVFMTVFVAERVFSWLYGFPSAFSWRLALELEEPLLDLVPMAGLEPARPFRINGF